MNQLTEPTWHSHDKQVLKDSFNFDKCQASEMTEITE
jgi:hypothetical protein